MKIALTISDIDGVSLPAILAALGIAPGSITINGNNSSNGATAGDDDDNTPTNTNAPAVDSTGLPWDERIHSKAKSQTESGAWRKRKGIADSMVTSVEAELRARGVPAQQQMQPQQPVTQPVPMMPPQMQQQPMQQPGPQPTGYPTGPGYPQQPGNVVQPQQMQPAPQPGPLAASMPYQPPVQQPAPQPQPGTLDFNGFMQTLTSKMQQVDANGAPLVDAGYFAKLTGEISQAFQVPMNVITDIASQPRVGEMVTYAVQCMARDQKW